MANEITKLGGNGKLNAQLLFIYRGIAAPTYVKADTSIATVIVTPSNELPDIAADVLTVVEKTALDAGIDAFEVVSMPVTDALTNSQLLAAARTLYANRKVRFTELLARRYSRAGQRFDEV